MAPSIEDQETNLHFKMYCGDTVISLPPELASECSKTKYPI